MGLLNRLSISQRPYALTDNAWAYGIGLGVVSAPVIWSLDVLGAEGGLRLPWLIVAVGALGMTISGMAIYSATLWPGRPIERWLLLTTIVPFVALFIASVPFIVFVVVGFFLAALFGLGLMPMAVVVTACWSAIYLSLPARERVPLYAIGSHGGRHSPGILIAGSLVLLTSLAIVLWFALGRVLTVRPAD
jgi:hypothetical protein